jgi:S-DNA-T family DNA segregation ATPase FtsK/SpoIIIE
MLKGLFQHPARGGVSHKLGESLPQEPTMTPVLLTDVVPAREPSWKARAARETAALALWSAAIFGLLCAGADQFGWPVGLGGPVGTSVAEHLIVLAGWGVFGLFPLVGWLALRLWQGESWRQLLAGGAGGLAALAALAALAGFFGGQSAGGLVGGGLADLLERYLSGVGALLTAAIVLLAGLVPLLKLTPAEILRGVFRVPKSLRRRLEADAPAGDPAQMVVPLEEDEHTLEPAASATAALPLAAAGAAKSLEVAPWRAANENSLPATRPAPSPGRRRGGTSWPLPLSMLDAPPPERRDCDPALLERSARLLEQKLLDFAVEGRVVEVQPGPVVTMYKFVPGVGVKVGQIVSLADDLSMALAAPVRIQAPIPGEAAVGIEVPNRRREKVYLREIIEAPEFAAAQNRLAIALGKDIAGQPVVADLAAMPHLLIAGATGTGKSVAIHAMLASILLNAGPEAARFILIDPKMLELSAYDGIPHLLVPVVCEVKKAAAALLWATQEMEQRYRLMHDLKARNLDAYNRALAAGAGRRAVPPPGGEAQGGGGSGGEPLVHRPLPSIVLVIDELADLLLLEGKSVERDITRLAQKARAAGIHLILSTQRPSVDVITGVIKANLPARISFQVASRVDSRTILDVGGAERLLGAGDMLYMPPGSLTPRRLHGPFVSEREIARLTEFLRGQGAPEYRMEILDTRTADEAEGDGADGGRDDMYDEAVRIVLESNQVSVSMLQRRLRVGYNRAARIVEQMEQEGLVGPSDGVRPREVRLARRSSWQS